MYAVIFTDTAMEKDQVFEYVLKLSPEDYTSTISELHFKYQGKTPELSRKIARSIEFDYTTKPEEFQEMITERKHEYSRNAKEGRQNDRERIAAMNSTTGISPLELFPKEIWLILLESMGPAERLHMHNLHGLFVDLLKDNKIGDVLLPLSIGVGVVPFCGSEEEENQSQNPASYNLADFLSLRMVSKSMCTAVDSWYEDNLVQQLRNGDMKEKPSNVLCFNLEKLADCRKVNDIMSNLNASGPRPIYNFFTRALKIVSPRSGDYNNQNPPEERDLFQGMEEKINNMLDQVGDQFLYFHFHFSHPSFNRRDHRTVKELPHRYNSFLGWVAKMPNLRWMKITINPMNMIRNVHDNNRWARAIEPPSSALPSLERLDFELTQKNLNALAIFNHILYSHRHVKHFNMSGLNDLFKEGLGPLNPCIESSATTMPLTVLGIRQQVLKDVNGESDEENESESDDDVSEDDEVDNIIYTEAEKNEKLLDIVVSNTWRLKRLEIDVNFEEIRLDWLFAVIANMRSLEDLRFAVTNPVIRHEIEYLDLPNLTRFEFALRSTESEMDCDFSNKIFSLHFLEMVQKLQHLSIGFDMRMGTWQNVIDEIENVNFVGEKLDFDKLMITLLGENNGLPVDERHSNIWHVFPALRRIKVKFVMRSIVGVVQKNVSKDIKKIEML